MEQQRLKLLIKTLKTKMESHHAPRPAVLPGGQADLGEEDRTEPRKGQEEEEGGGGGGGVGNDEGGATPLG